MNWGAIFIFLEHAVPDCYVAFPWFGVGLSSPSPCLTLAYHSPNPQLCEGGGCVRFMFLASEAGQHFTILTRQQMPVNRQ